MTKKDFPLPWLAGWKDIAKYIGKTVRTAKTYHYKLSMPIHKSPGGLPMALPAEIDFWIIEFEKFKRKHILDRNKQLNQNINSRPRKSGKFVK